MTKITRRAALAAPAAMLATTASPAATETEAARLARAWAEALDAQQQACDVFNAAEETYYDSLPPLGKKPAAPSAYDFASPETKAEAENFVQEGGDLGRRLRENGERAEAEAAKNPAYQEAMQAHEKALADWQARRDQRHGSEEYRKVEATEEAYCHAIEAKDNAARALIAAPIHSQVDALAVTAAAMYWAEINDDARVMPQELRRRIAPWLPSAPKNWTA